MEINIENPKWICKSVKMTLSAEDRDCIIHVQNLIHKMIYPDGYMKNYDTLDNNVYIKTICDCDAVSVDTLWQIYRTLSQMQCSTEITCGLIK